ncbi:MAG TPA: PAS domain S-box protein, partial [Dissulfurispiraceae bacterium]|nr:PAS domain S-box protein [Dissulfurispiraceae bacterium]
MTGRKHTYKIPRENRKFAEILIEHSAVATFVLNTDHKVLIWNRACTELTGFPSSQMIGTDNQWKPFYDHKRPCLSDIVLDADFNGLPDLYQTYGKSALSPGALYAEGRYQNLNGKDRYILFEAAPVYDGKGELIAAIETLQDVTKSRQAEDLRESEDKFRNLAERALIGIYLIQDGLFRYVNPRLAEIFGYEVDELLHKKTPKDLVLEEDWPLVEQNILKRVSGEVETRHYGFRGITKQGEIVFIDVYGTRTIYQARPAVIGTLLDITERNKAEAELRKSEEAYRRLVETASEGIWSVDSQYRTTFVNKAMSRMLDYAYEEMLETPIERYIFDEDLEEHRLRMEVRRSGVSEHFERRYRRKDGDVCWCLVSATPLQDSEGRFVGSFFMCTDITKRKGVEDAHRKSEAKLILFKSLIDQVNDAVFVADPETSSLMDVNNTACDTLGYEREELLKMTVLDLGHPGMSDLSAWKTHVADVKNKKHVVIESEQRRKDGTTLPVEINTNYVSHDARDYMVAIIRDVTERKKVEDQLHSLAYYDTLTGLPNRALFKELLQRALEYAKRYNRTFSIFFIDLDNFKRINDTLGHDVGDELLQVVADRLLKSMRTSDCASRSNEKAITDVVSRQGGDEFILLLHNLVKPADAAHSAGRVLKVLAEPYEMNGREVFITASIGISLYPEDGDNIDSILKNADTAMYQAKIKGKNNYQFYSIEMN